jgi:hypothetical protein
MDDVYYVIETENHTFQVLITHDFGKKQYIILNSAGKECMSVNIELDSNTLYLSMLKFNEDCALNYPMVHGSATIEMMKSLLRFISQQETFTKVSFIDTSEFQCRLSQNDEAPYDIPIPLAFHNITIYGKTWYERHFQATISDPELQERIQRSIERLHAIIKKDSVFLRFERNLLNIIHRTESKRFRTVLLNVVELLRIATDHSSWMTLFNDLFGSLGLIADKYGRTYSCSLYYMFDNAINELFLIPFECNSLPMEITLESILDYPEIKSVQQNANPKHRKSWGGERTRRKGRISIYKYYNKLSLKNK